MKTYTYTIKIHPAEEDEGGYWVEVPALPGCHTQGETYEQAVAHAHEAILCYLEGLRLDGEPIPEEPHPVANVEAPVRVELPERV